MTYLTTPAESPLYPADPGLITNYLRVFALRPEAYAGWRQLVGSVTAGMDLRRYELVTLAASRGVGSAYCTLAHASVLRDKFYDDTALSAIAADHHTAPLDPVDVSIMDFAARFAADPTKVTEPDIDGLRQHGLSDVEIFEIVLTICLRRFFSGVLSAVGAEPDAVYDELDPQLRAALSVPR